MTGEDVLFHPVRVIAAFQVNQKMTFCSISGELENDILSEHDFLTLTYDVEAMQYPTIP
jgi:hypothetical protein